MKLLFAIIYFMFCFQIVFAQVRISGKITDAKKNPLSGASITLKDTYDGATSDSTGNYSFFTSEKGNQILVISYVGYKTIEQNIIISSAPIELSVALKQEVNELNAVVISAGSFEASDKKKATVLNPIDIVTTASALADVTGALKTLPGAQQVGESEGLFVRGGTATETKTFIDGTLINNFFFSSVPNIAQRGRFSPFIFKGTLFSTGGYSALYGQALSSALILESIDLPDQSAANLGFSVLSLNAGFQKLAKNKKASYGVNYSYTNLWAAFKVIKQRQDFFKIPEYQGADANFRIKTKAGGMIKYYGYFSANRLGFRTNSIDTLGFKDKFGLKNIYFYHNLSYKEYLSNNWKLFIGFSYNNNKDNIESANLNAANEEVLITNLEFKKFALETKGNYINSKIVLEKKFTGLTTLRFGSEYNYSHDKTDYRFYTGSIFPYLVKENIFSGFAESDIYLTNDIAAKTGFRLERSSILNKVNFAPRISIAYKTGKESQASLAYGIFYQNPETRYLPATNPLTFAKATHYIAQYQKTNNQITFRTEIFYKKYQNLIKTSAAFGKEEAINNNGFGDAKGFEIFWRDKKNIKNVDYWISYSYLDTKRDFLTYPALLNPSFASTHTASLVVKKFVMNWKTGFNVAYTFASGRPYYNIQYDYVNNKYRINDQGRTPAYHNVGFSLNYLPNLNSKNANKFTVIVLSVSNIFGIDQVFGYNYSFNGKRKEAIVPPSRRFVFIGVFLSFGVDRSQDVINSNL